MYNSCAASRKTPLLGLNVTQSWSPTLKRGLRSQVEDFLTFPPTLGDKTFTNPNFVNENNPSLLSHQDFYQPRVANNKHCTTDNNHKKSPVEPSPPPPPQQQQQEIKKKRKRKRRNRKKNKKTNASVKNEESKTTAMPELTKSFKNFSVQSSGEVELARSGFRTRVPSICESEDSFIVFEDPGLDEAEESAIESDGVVEESTEVSENEGMSSDSCIPHKKVRFAADENLCEVHPMVQWSYAYHTARKGPWEQYARDRERFTRRIRETEKTLSSVLNPLHREKIFENRFREFCVV